MGQKSSSGENVSGVGSYAGSYVPVPGVPAYATTGKKTITNMTPGPSAGSSGPSRGVTPGGYNSGASDAAKNSPMITAKHLLGSEGGGSSFIHLMSKTESAS